MFIHVPGPTPPPNCPGPWREMASRGRLRVSESLISKWLREGPGVAEGQLTGEGGLLVALLAPTCHVQGLCTSARFDDSEVSPLPHFIRVVVIRGPLLSPCTREGSNHPGRCFGHVTVHANPQGLCQVQNMTQRGPRRTWTWALTTALLTHPGCREVDRTQRVLSPRSQAVAGTPKAEPWSHGEALFLSCLEAGTGFGLGSPFFSARASPCHLSPEFIQASSQHGGLRGVSRGTGPGREAGCPVFS